MTGMIVGSSAIVVDGGSQSTGDPQTKGGIGSVMIETATVAGRDMLDPGRHCAGPPAAHIRPSPNINLKRRGRKESEYRETINRV
jgi:hypothetical protein